MIVTKLEAPVAVERADDFVRAFEGSTAVLPPPIVETFLVRPRNGDRWEIITVWRSADDLDAYRRSVDTPEGVLMFRAVDAEPDLTVFDVAAHAGASPASVR